MIPSMSLSSLLYSGNVLVSPIITNIIEILKYLKLSYKKVINEEKQSRHQGFGQWIIKQETIQQCNYNSAELNHVKAFLVFFSYCDTYLLKCISHMYLIIGVCNTKTCIGSYQVFDYRIAAYSYGTVQLQLHTRVICHAWYHALFSVKRKFVTRESEYSHA